MQAVRDYAGLLGGSRLSFWDAMRALQYADLPPRKEAVSVIWFDGAGHPFESAMDSLMGGVVSAHEARSYPPAERNRYTADFARALALFENRFPELYGSFRALIGWIVFARRDGYSGGTVSDRIGLIWLAPELEWTVESWLENLIHEFVHNALFLEDMVHGVLAAGGKRLEEPDALAISSIRQVKRGYDKAYHSGFVSLTLIEMYEQLALPERARPFLAALVVCVEDLIKQRAFATVNGRDLLVELARESLQRWRLAEGETHEATLLH